MKPILAFLLFAGSAVGAMCQTPGLTAPALWSPENVPFSFTYDGRESRQLLATWKTSHENVTGKSGRLQRYTYTDPATHLTVIAEVRVYPDFPDAIDWVLKFRNDGTADTPIIENILPLWPARCFVPVDS